MSWFKRRVKVSAIIGSTDLGLFALTSDGKMSKWEPHACFGRGGWVPFRTPLDPPDVEPIVPAFKRRSA